MSAPLVKALIEDVEKRGGTEGSEEAVCERLADLQPSDLLALIYDRGTEMRRDASGETEDRLYEIEALATVLACRVEPVAWRRAIALVHPDFVFSGPHPLTGELAAA